MNVRDEERIGVLVMSYGTPESMEQIQSYYTHIRRGRPPEPEQLKELTERYEAIGGFFPLRENTNRQVAGLSAELNRHAGPVRYECYQGLKHAAPLIEDGVEQMAADGIKTAVGVVLAPHYSVMSVGSYIERAKKAAAEHGVNMRFVRSYHLHPKLLDAWAQRVDRAIAEFVGVPKDEIRVIYSAHSLPEKILELNDPYPQQLLETSQAVSDRCGIRRWQFAWQSAGQTAMPWLGPDILDVLREVRDVKHVLICPLGFVSDHLEVLYDIDIECAQAARELGLKWKRTEMLGTDPLYMETLADVVRQEWQGE